MPGPIVAAHVRTLPCPTCQVNYLTKTTFALKNNPQFT